jgi:hypothetical protein
MSKKKIYGVFDEEDVMMEAIAALKAAGRRVTDVISPYPVHGMDEALGLNRTRISICCFLYGITGTCLAVLMMWYMNIFDWPMDIGGKPSFNLYKNFAAFVPVTFESTVLCAAHGMVITFYLRSKLLPGVEPPVYHARQADDYFVMTLEVQESDVKSASADLKKAGAVEIKS